MGERFLLPIVREARPPYRRRRVTRWHAFAAVLVAVGVVGWATSQRPGVGIAMGWIGVVVWLAAGVKR